MFVIRFFFVFFEYLFSRNYEIYLFLFVFNIILLKNVKVNVMYINEIDFFF